MPVEEKPRLNLPCNDSAKQKKKKKISTIMRCEKEKNRCSLMIMKQFISQKPMIGFGVLNESHPKIHRTLTEAAIRPPYFYYENVALTPKGIWTTISRFLYDVEPEFID